MRQARRSSLRQASTTEMSIPRAGTERVSMTLALKTPGALTATGDVLVAIGLSIGAYPDTD